MSFTASVQKTGFQILSIVLLLMFSVSSCKHEVSCHDEMIFLFEKHSNEPYHHYSQMYPKLRILHVNSSILVSGIRSETRVCKCLKAHLLMELGQKEEAAKILETLKKKGENNPFGLNSETYSLSD